MFHLCKYTPWDEVIYQVREKACDYRLVMMQTRVCTICNKRDMRTVVVEQADSYSYVSVLQRNCDMLNRKMEAITKQKQVRD